MMNHWVGHSLMKPIDVGECLNRRVVIRELVSSLNEYNKIDAPVGAQGKTEASVVADVVQFYGINMGEVGEELEDIVFPQKQNEESLMNIEKGSVDVGTMNKALEASSIPIKQNE